MPRKKYYDLNKELYLQQSREDYINNINKRKATHNSYYQKNTESIKKRTREYSISYLSDNFIKKMLWSAKGTAKKRGLDFLIQKEDITIPNTCPYLGVELTTIMGKGRVPYNASIDRIDNSKGYIPGNVQIISCLANLMKNNATIQELVAFAKGVLKTHAS